MKIRRMIAKAIGLGAAVAALGLSAASPGDGFGQSAGALPDRPVIVSEREMPDSLGKLGGTLILDNVDDPKTFNPITAREDSSDAVLSLLHAGLVEGDGSPAVAESFEISNDERAVTFVIRAGIKFSDGTPVTAEDVRFTLADVVFNESVDSNKEVWRVNGLFPSIEVVDARTLRISTSVPFTGIFNALADTPILPKHLLQNLLNQFNQAWGITTTPSAISGLGPFRLKSYAPGQQVVVERNPYYWKADEAGAQLPYLDQIILSVATDDDVRLLRFLNGQTEIYSPRPEDLAAIRERESQGFVVHVLPAGTTDSNVFSFNQDAADANLQRLFRDERFRQAMSHAADRSAMIETSLDGLGEARYGPGISAEYWIGDAADFPQYSFNLDRAKQLLDQIGLTDSNSDGIRQFPNDYPQPGAPVQFELLTVQDSNVLVNDAIIYAQALKELGLQVTVTPVAFNALVTRLLNTKSPQYQAARITITFSGDPNFLGDIYGAKGPLHFWKFSDALGQDLSDWQSRVDQILAQQAIVSNPGVRNDLLEEFQRLVAGGVPLVYLYNAQGLESYRADRIGNFSGTERSVTLLSPELIFKR